MTPVRSPAPGRPRPSSARHWRWVGWTATLFSLLLVFWAYRQPEMMMQMAQQLWSCF